MRPFHLAFTVDDLAVARAFYVELLACPEGRSAETWVDFDPGRHSSDLSALSRPSAISSSRPGPASPLSPPTCIASRRLRNRNP